MTNTLHGLRVLVTRPDPSGSSLCRLIEAEGGRAIHFPSIAFAPPADNEVQSQAMAALGQQDWLIFISPQAVYASIPLIRRVWPNFPPSLKFAAVGEGTANALKEAGYVAVAYPKAEWTSEGLLTLPAFQAIAGQKITIIRGQGGRQFLENSLKHRGAIITPMMVYQRLLPETDIKPMLHLLKEKAIDVMICTSYEGVQNLKQMIPPSHWDDLCRLPMITVSERIKMLAHDLDFQTIWIARNASHQAILAALGQKKDELCQMKMK